MEERWVLLGENVAQFRVSILGSREGAGHGSVRCVEVRDLGSGLWVDEWWKECGIRMREVENNVLDMVPDPAQGLYARLFGEAVWGEAEMHALEEPARDEVTTGRIGQPD